MYLPYFRFSYTFCKGIQMSSITRRPSTIGEKEELSVISRENCKNKKNHKMNHRKT